LVAAPPRRQIPPHVAVHVSVVAYAVSYVGDAAVATRDGVAALVRLHLSNQRPFQHDTGYARFARYPPFGRWDARQTALTYRRERRDSGAYSSMSPTSHFKVLHSVSSVAKLILSVFPLYMALIDE